MMKTKKFQTLVGLFRKKECNAHLHITLKTSDVMAKNRVSEVAYRNNKIS